MEDARLEGAFWIDDSYVKEGALRLVSLEFSCSGVKACLIVGGGCLTTKGLPS